MEWNLHESTHDSLLDFLGVRSYFVFGVFPQHGGDVYVGTLTVAMDIYNLSYIYYYFIKKL